MKHCVKCGKKTKLALSWDIDSTPTPTCKKCKDDVRMALMMLVMAINHGDWNMVTSFTKKWHEPIKPPEKS